MRTGRKRSAFSYFPGFTNNAVLKLAIGLLVAYVLFALVWAVLRLVYESETNFNTYFMPNMGLPVLALFKTHWWTLLIYGWFHAPNTFMEMASNMLWLYCFGSVVQMLVGPKHIIPLFGYSLLTGGVVYLLGQMLPGGFGACPPYLLGPRAGLMAMAAAAVTLTPKYRFYLTETFSIPLMVVAGIFGALMILGSGFYLPIILLLAGGALAGFGYVKLLQAGYRPADWIYKLTDKAESMVTPSEDAVWQKHNRTRSSYMSNLYEPKSGISQKRIDEILDKINQKGYNSLSSEEKDVLMRAGKD
jgi:membrane associated rhomboid family serine protease